VSWAALFGTHDCRRGNRPRCGAAVRLIVVDESALFRQGLTAPLTEAGHEIVEQQRDATALLPMVAAKRPDATILDIRMPLSQTTEGLLAVVELRERCPDVAVLVLSQYAETAHAVRLLSDGSGRIGYLLKDRVGEMTELVDALERITAGGTVIDPEVVRVLIGHTERIGWKG
jgi:DNA-binding NarL/FixJ family response regulator